MCLLATLWPLRSYGVPAAPGIRELTQPDGTVFRAVLWGDERMHGWETEDGYTIVREANSGYWNYALHGKDGSLVSSGRRVGIDPRPGNLEKHLRLTGDAQKHPPDLRPHRKTKHKKPVP